MLRKKNYKQQDHFTEFHTFNIPLESGKRIIVYYKRYRPKITVTQKVGQIYDMVNAKNNNKKPQPVNSPYPIDRTIEIMTFDEELKGKIEPIMKKIGKIRKFQFGKGEFKNREIFFCIVIFKYEFDLVKCFREQFIQTIIQQEFKFHQNEQDKDDFRSQMIETYLKTELQSKNKKIKQLHDEGYNLITKKTGQFNVDRENNLKWVQDLPQIKKKKKLQQKAQDSLKTKLE